MHSNNICCSDLWCVRLCGNVILFRHSSVLNWHRFFLRSFTLPNISREVFVDVLWSVEPDRLTQEKKSTKIYYNQISLWSELEEDVKMQSMLKMVWVIFFEGIWTFGTPSVGCDSPPRCLSARSLSAARWPKQGTGHAVVQGLAPPPRLHKLKLYACILLRDQ